MQFVSDLRAAVHPARPEGHDVGGLREARQRRGDPRGHRWDFMHRLRCRGSPHGVAWRVGVASSDGPDDVIIIQEPPGFFTVAEDSSITFSRSSTSSGALRRLDGR